MFFFNHEHFFQFQFKVTFQAGTCGVSNISAESSRAGSSTGVCHSWSINLTSLFLNFETRKETEVIRLILLFEPMLAIYYSLSISSVQCHKFNITDNIIISPKRTMKEREVIILKAQWNINTDQQESQEIIYTSFSKSKCTSET